MVVKQDPIEITESIENKSKKQKIVSLDNVKTDFFESKDRVTLTLYVKDIDPKNSHVEFTESTGQIRFKTNDNKFLQTQKCEDSSTLFELDVDFYHNVKSTNCTYKINRSTMELHLSKATSDQKWPQALKKKDSKHAVINDSSTNNISTSVFTTSESIQTNSGIGLTKNQPTCTNTKESIQISSKSTIETTTSTNTNTNRTKPNKTRSESNSISPPPRAPYYRQETGPAVRPGSNYYGFTGLVNLGNTCYMNAAIQLLVNATDFRDYFLENAEVFRKEINTNNALGLNGKSAVQFAILLRQIWSGSTSYLAPNKLRDLISIKFTHFRGFEQQDTQEFLCSLLSLLHEDLNRVTKKPFYESSLECENDSDFNTLQIANESWKRFLTRENSVVVDNFYGQFKSKLTCPECHKVSITFEPFNNLLVPIARPKARIDFILVFNSNRNKYPINTSLYFDENSLVKDLLNHVYNQFIDTKNSMLEAFVIKKCFNNATDSRQMGFKFDTDYSLLLENEKIPSLSGDQFIVITESDNLMKEAEPILELRVQQVSKYPLSDLSTENSCSYCGKEAPVDENNKAQKLPRCTKCFRSSYCNSECQKLDWSKHSLNVCSLPIDRVGFPFLVRFKRSELDGEEGKSLIRKTLMKHSSMSTDLSGLDESKKNNFELQIVETTSQNDEPRINYIQIDSNFEKLMAVFENKITSNHNKLVVLKVQMKWNTNKVGTNLNKVMNVKNNENVSTHVDLNDCLRLFTQPERLTSDNPWYCSRCKKHQEAEKHMNLWKLPKYLIISLKRFQATKADSFPFMNMNDETAKYMMMNSRFSYLLQNRVVYNKLNTMVKFPIKNLDMTKYLIHPNIDSSGAACSNNLSSTSNNMYDLCAVINHLGQSISVGHYTAFARTHDRENTVDSQINWRLFDDQMVEGVEHENHIITKDAYVLMYRLRSGQSLNMEPEVNNQSEPVCSINRDAALLNPSGSDSDNERNEEFYDIESDESAQLNDEDDDRDQAIDLSDNETGETNQTAAKQEIIMGKFTNLEETD